MFVWRADAVLQELKEQLPAHLTALSRAVESDGAPQWQSELEKAFRGLQSISVDFGIMEHAADVRCAAATFSWSDVGGWAALSEHLPNDGHGNHYRGAITTLEARDNLVFCEEADETVALIGVSGLVVVRAGGKTLIAAKERAEELKQLVKEHDLA
jgi:mannose-1-phosphate guanylyltransferase